MSGINKMMDKMKQKKMTLDDLPSPTMENRESQKDTVHTDERKSVHTAVQEAVSTAKRETQQAVNAANVTYGEAAGRNHLGNSNEQEAEGVKTEIQNCRNTSIQQYGISVNTARQQDRPMKKVTYYLTEEMHKAFEDVYARRIIEGRKTDKSTLISEAVELLHKSELARYNNVT
jgi:hypothetical protein